MPHTNETWQQILRQKTPQILQTTPPAAAADAAADAAAGPASDANPLPADFAVLIDHTLLKPSATPHQIDSLCDEAITHRFTSVCVNGIYASRASRRLADTPVKTCVVIGFPLGAVASEVKAFEAQTAISQGATEIDTVLAVGLLKSRDYVSVYADIRAVVTAAAPYPVKVIIETFLLTDEEKVAACIIAAEAGAAFVKTCTGFSGGEATAEDVRLMGRAVEGYRWSGGGYDGGVRVKASGGVRGFDGAVEMLKAGASRIGTSSGVAIVENVPTGNIPAGKY